MSLPLPTRRQWLMLAMIVLLWGLNWPLMKFSLREVPPLTFRAVTMTGGALVLAAWFSARGVALALPAGALRPLLVVTLPNIVGWHLASIIGLSMLPSGRATILAFTMPVWIVLLGAVLFGQALTRRAAVACVFALVAVGLLAFDELTSLAGRPLGVLWLQAAALSWALGTLLVKRTTLALSTEALTVWMMTLGSVFFTVAALAVDGLPAWRGWSGATWASLAWGVLINFGVSQVLWFSMARELPPQASGFSMMAVPVVGVFSAAALFGELPELRDGLALLCIAVAIAAATGLGGDNRRR